MIEPLELFRHLQNAYGAQGWWPLYRRRETYGFDSRGYRLKGHTHTLNSADRFEIIIGTILTQNTNWRNVEKSIHALQIAGIDTPHHLAAIPVEGLEELIRSSGYFRQKARRLKWVVAQLFSTDGRARPDPPERDYLLSIKGIGAESADSILLYAFGIPYFIADLYTRRLTARLAGELQMGNYEKVRGWYEAGLPGNTELYAEFHALIVEHGKQHCAARPACAGCPCLDFCAYGDKRL